jgi:hypothetical protein
MSVVAYRQYDQMEIVGDARRSRETGEPMVNLVTTNGPLSTLVSMSLEELARLPEMVRRVLDPTAEELYESTLENAYDGEDGGSVDGPVGWFARIRWDNGRWYLIWRGTEGTTSVMAQGEGPTRRYFDEESDALAEITGDMDDQAAYSEQD